jgi:hypothetical protein
VYLNSLVISILRHANHFFMFLALYYDPPSSDGFLTFFIFAEALLRSASESEGDGDKRPKKGRESQHVDD